MKKIIHLTLLVCAVACETIIEPDINEPAGVLVVDAWLTQDQGVQEIKLTRSQGYFNDSQPEEVMGAVVTVADLNNGAVYHFEENYGQYQCRPDSIFGSVGHDYRLTILLDGEEFEAQAHLGEVPNVDSIAFQYNPEDYNILSAYFSAEFFATDLPGTGNTYWIKAWKNGVFLNKPAEINIAYDAGFGAGQQVDGVVFHKTIRRDYINPLEERPDRANYYYPPYEPGDSVYVEIHSIDPVAYDYLSAVRTQTDRPGGFSELFAVPLANVLTNLTSTDPNSSTPIAGFFNISSVSSGGRKLTNEMAAQLQK